MTAPIIIGVDLSLTATGIALAAGGTTIRTDAAHPIESRLQAIRNRVSELAAHAELVVIEDFVTRSPAASTLGMMHGIVRVRLREDGHPFVLVPPATLKKYVTGKGNAKKDDMRMAIYQRFGLDFSDNNQADAFGLMALGLDAYGHPLADMPAVNRGVLEKIEWPALDQEQAA